MTFLEFIFYLINNGFLLFFSGKKFNSKLGISKNQKVMADIVFKLILTAILLIDMSNSNLFIPMTVISSIVLIIYLHLYKDGSLLEHIYWVTLVQCITNCTTLIVQLLVLNIPVSFFSYHLGYGLDFLIIALVLAIQYFALLGILNVSPKLNYLGFQVLGALTGINIFWILIIELLSYIKDFNFALIAAIMLLISHSIYFVIMNLLSKNINKLTHIESEYQNMKLKTKYYEEVEVINQEVRRYRHDLANHLHMLYYFLEERNIEAATEYLNRMGVDLKKINKGFYYIKTRNEAIDNHLHMLYYFLEERNIEAATEYLNRMGVDLKKINKGFYYIKTRNEAIDFILNSKLLIAREKGIKIKSTVEDMEILFIRNVDICTLLSNLLDNAIEACALYKGDESFIDLDMRLIKRNFAINIKNSANPVKTDENGNYLTNKKSGDHGFGMLQINRIIKQYNGYISRKYENNVFETNILLMNPVG